MGVSDAEMNFPSDLNLRQRGSTSALKRRSNSAALLSGNFRMIAFVCDMVYVGGIFTYHLSLDFLSKMLPCTGNQRSRGISRARCPGLTELIWRVVEPDWIFRCVFAPQLSKIIS